MRAVVSIILAAILLTVPITQVLAQAGQQAQSIVTTDSTATPQERIGVPEPEGKGALLWLAGDPAPVVSDSLASARRASTGEKIGLVVMIAAVVVVFVVIVSNLGLEFGGGAWTDT